MQNRTKTARFFFVCFFNVTSKGPIWNITASVNRLNRLFSFVLVWVFFSLNCWNNTQYIWSPGIFIFLFFCTLEKSCLASKLCHLQTTTDRQTHLTEIHKEYSRLRKRFPAKMFTQSFKDVSISFFFSSWSLYSVPVCLFSCYFWHSFCSFWGRYSETFHHPSTSLFSLFLHVQSYWVLLIRSKSNHKPQYPAGETRLMEIDWMLANLFLFSFFFLWWKFKMRQTCSSRSSSNVVPFFFFFKSLQLFSSRIIIVYPSRWFWINKSEEMFAS